MRSFIFSLAALLMSACASASAAVMPADTLRTVIPGDTVREVIVIRDTVYITTEVPVMQQRMAAEDSIIYRSAIIQERRREFWRSMTPDYSNIQFAGGMGMFSIGPGWDYGRKRQWETEFLIGFVPRFNGNRPTLTLTLKENYIPWRIALGEHFAFEPLETGLYFTFVTSKQFWGNEPKKYGGSYYKYTQDFRLNIFIGHRIKWEVGRNPRAPIKTLALYFETSTNDLYLISRVPNHTLSTWDILVFSTGIKMYFE